MIEVCKKAKSLVDLGSRKKEPEDKHFAYGSGAGEKGHSFFFSGTGSPYRLGLTWIDSDAQLTIMFSVQK